MVPHGSPVHSVFGFGVVVQVGFALSEAHVKAWRVSVHASVVVGVHEAVVVVSVVHVVGLVVVGLLLLVGLLFMVCGLLL